MAEDTRRIGETDQRSWLGVTGFELLDMRLTPTDSKRDVDWLWFTARVSATNSGKIPATHAFVHCKATTSGSDKFVEPAPWPEDLDIMESEMAFLSTNNGQVVPPSVTIVDEIQLKVEEPKPGAWLDRGFILKARVVIIYRQTLDGKVCITSQDFLITKTQPQSATRRSFDRNSLMLRNV